MALPYKKWTEDDIKNRNVVPEGDYPFTILNASRLLTKGGFDKNGKQKEIHEMLEIEFEFYDKNGVIRKLRSWIVFVENMDWLLRHLANTTGTLDLYDSNELDCQHLIRKTGVFKLGIKENEYQGEKRQQNYVKDYIKKSVSNPAQDPDFVDDDISI